MRVLGIDIPCHGRLYGNPFNGYDFDCGYEKSEDIECDDCICNYGFYNPETGKKINWVLRIIQRHRARKHYNKIKV